MDHIRMDDKAYGSVASASLGLVRMKIGLGVDAGMPLAVAIDS
jgi:hypothetical protein